VLVVGSIWRPPLCQSTHVFCCGLVDAVVTGEFCGSLNSSNMTSGSLPSVVVVVRVVQAFSVSRLG